MSQFPTPATPDPACAAARTDLAGLDGHELSTRRATEVRAHLSTCSECGELAASYRTLRRTLSDLATVPATPPEGLLESILDRAASVTPRERAAVIGRGAVSGARPRLVAAGAGVGAVAAAGVGVLAWRALRARRSVA
jgi:predicted anti-sigma-YlaC factor YlaD